MPAVQVGATNRSKNSVRKTPFLSGSPVAGVSRVVAPVLSTTLFQRVSHGMPFYFAATFVGLVSLLAFQVDARPAPEPVRVVD